MIEIVQIARTAGETARGRGSGPAASLAVRPQWTQERQQELVCVIEDLCSGHTVKAEILKQLESQLQDPIFEKHAFRDLLFCDLPIELVGITSDEEAWKRVVTGSGTHKNLSKLLTKIADVRNGEERIQLHLSHRFGLISKSFPYDSVPTGEEINKRLGRSVDVLDHALNLIIGGERAFGRNEPNWDDLLARNAEFPFIKYVIKEVKALRGGESFTSPLACLILSVGRQMEGIQQEVIRTGILRDAFETAKCAVERKQDLNALQVDFVSRHIEQTSLTSFISRGLLSDLFQRAFDHFRHRSP